MWNLNPHPLKTEGAAPKKEVGGGSRLRRWGAPFDMSVPRIELVRGVGAVDVARREE
jgi:hypothetical protein